jgi:hypothetical protein
VIPNAPTQMSKTKPSIANRHKDNTNKGEQRVFRRRFEGLHGKKGYYVEVIVVDHAEKPSGN